MTRRLKVFVSAYACEPDKGSEPGIGWNWVKQSARFHQVWAITRASNRPAIERALEKEAMPTAHWVYFDLPRWARFWKKGERGVHFYYYLWQIGAYFVGKQLHKEVGFDLVHHVTFGNCWTPSLVSLVGAPFIWGPLGGGEAAPKAFWRSFNWRGKVYDVLRDAARGLGHRDPFVRLTARRAALALAATNETARELSQLGCKPVEIHSNVGLPREEIEALAIMPHRQGNPFRLISIGRLLHWKGFHLGLKAFAKLHQQFPNSEYHIIGDGPERRSLERLAQGAGVANKVRFWGVLPRSEVLQRLSECDVLVHPSLHDSGGWVCVEGMAASRPVICLDLGGPALQVTEETGIKVAAGEPEQVVNELAEGMLQLGRNDSLRKQMGQAAQRRAAEYFDWDKKGERLQEIYQSIFQSCERQDKYL